LQHIIKFACQQDSLSRFTDFIVNVCDKHTVELGTHKHGCCVIQRCIEQANPKQRLLIAGSVIRHLPELIDDQFGNYLVQHTLKLQDWELNKAVYCYIAENFYSLAKLKFASNVIEKCLDHQPCLIEIERTLTATVRMEELATDKYGNYVI
jgi:pumilio RNA-binding family